MNELRPDHPKTYPVSGSQHLAEQFNATFRKDVLRLTRKKFQEKNERSLLDSPHFSPNEDVMKVSNFAEKEPNKRLQKIKAAIGQLKLSPSLKRSKFGQVKEEQEEMDLSPGMAPLSPTKS